MDFIIESSGAVSQGFLARGITGFVQASQYIKTLPYLRNTDKNNILCVLEDGFGTCGTKHALLAELCIENNHGDIELTLGIFKMGRPYSNPVGDVLEKYRLEFIPEAHNYLKYKGEVFDFTTPTSKKEDFIHELMDEITISPNQITDFKVHYHKKFLAQWIETDKISYTLGEIWEIREECIEAMSST